MNASKPCVVSGLSSDIMWETYPFMSICFSYAVEYPFITRLGLQAHL